MKQLVFQTFSQDLTGIILRHWQCQWQPTIQTNISMQYVNFVVQSAHSRCCAGVRCISGSSAVTVVQKEAALNTLGLVKWH